LHRSSQLAKLHEINNVWIDKQEEPEILGLPLKIDLVEKRSPIRNNILSIKIKIDDDNATYFMRQGDALISCFPEKHFSNKNIFTKTTDFLGM
jgi:hypothetical protein